MFDKASPVQYSSQAPADSAAVPPSASAFPDPPPSPPEGWLDQLLAFIYTFAHWIGGLMVNFLQDFFPLQDPDKLVDPIGYLVLLTLFLIVAEIAKKIVWLVVVVGWLLIIVRIVLGVMQSQV